MSSSHVPCIDSILHESAKKKFYSAACYLQIANVSPENCNQSESLYKSFLLHMHACNTTCFPLNHIPIDEALIPAQ